MDQSKIFNKDIAPGTIENILEETKKNNDHTFLNSQLLTIIKDLVVKQTYIQRKNNCSNPFNLRLGNQGYHLIFAKQNI